MIFSAGTPKIVQAMKYHAPFFRKHPFAEQCPICPAFFLGGYIWIFL